MRNKLAVSDIKEFTEGANFSPVILDDVASKEIAKVIFCSGRIYYDLLQEKNNHSLNDDYYRWCCILHHTHCYKESHIITNTRHRKALKNALSHLKKIDLKNVLQLEIAAENLKIALHRTEEDSLGEVSVPSDKYWGAQTQRSILNFSIGHEKMQHQI